MKFLSVGLPEDVQRELFLGNIGKALQLIEKKLTSPLPKLLKERLLYEKERLNRLILDYPYSIKDAKKIAKKTIKGFSELEFEQLLNNGDLDYIIIDGNMYFEKRFAFNIGFKYDEYKKRIKTDEKVLKGRELLHNRLDKIINGDKNKSYKVKARITVTPDYENIMGEKIKVWLPIPHESFQISNVKILDTSHEKFTILNSQQRTIYFEDETTNKSSFYVEFEYKISEWIDNIDINKVTEINFSNYKEFLVEKPPHILFTHYLKNLTEEIVGNEKNPYLKAKLIYDWITLNIKYSYVKPYGIYENIPQFVATNLKGDCGFQALLFITMCRIARIPSRWQSGWYINKYFASPHDWALFYIEPYGWLPADLSFGGARRNIPKYRKFYFGNLDGFRMVANNDFMVRLKNKKYYRSDPYDNQVGELETELGNIYSDKYTYKIKVISFEEVDDNE